MSPVEAISLIGLEREEWLKARQQGIGSSDAAAVVGLDSFRSPFSLWLQKTGQLPEQEETDAMRWGMRLESAIADEFQDTNDAELNVIVPQSMFRHSTHEWMLASPDRLLAKDLVNGGDVIGVLEIKTSGFADRWADGIPEPYQVQVQHQLSVMDLYEAYVAVLIGGRTYRTFHVERDDEAIEALQKLERDFWFENVLANVPPPTDGHVSTTEALKQLYASVRPGAEVDLPEDVTHLLSTYQAAKQHKAHAEEILAGVENWIKEQMGDAELGLYGNKTIATWKAPKQKAHPHNCPDCTHPCTDEPSRRFLIKKEAFDL